MNRISDNNRRLKNKTGNQIQSHRKILKVQSKKTVTYGEWFNKWIDVYKANTVKESTIQCYKDYYNCRIAEYMGDIDICSIDSETIQKFYSSLSERNYSVNSIKVISNILKCSFEKATKCGIIKNNPCDDAVVPIAKQEKERRALTKPEQEIFVKYAECSYLSSFFIFMLRTGLRNGEARGLKWGDIDFEKGLIHIQRTITYISGKGNTEGLPKSKTSIRDIPVTDDIRKLLVSHKKETSKECDYVFTNSRGKVLGRDIVETELDKIITAINDGGIVFDRITAHNLRHTFATRAIEAGMQPQVLKTIMGHSSIAVTMDIYNHVMFDVKKNEMEMISSAFSI